MYDDISIVIISYRVFSLPLKILCTLPIHLTLPHPSHWSFYFLHSFAFFQNVCHIVDIIWYIGFSDWLLSLSNIHLRFLHVSSWLDGSFLSFFFLINLFILFIYFWLRWVFVAARGLSLVVASGGLLFIAVCRLLIVVASRCGAWALGMRASVVVACRLSSCGSRALERRLGSCGTETWLLRGTWDLPRPGLEPVSPALAGGFLTTALPGKSMAHFFLALNNIPFVWMYQFVYPFTYWILFVSKFWQLSIKLL